MEKKYKVIEILMQLSPYKSSLKLRSVEILMNAAAERTKVTKNRFFRTVFCLNRPSIPLSRIRI